MTRDTFKAKGTPPSVPVEVERLLKEARQPVNTEDGCFSPSVAAFADKIEAALAAEGVQAGDASIPRLPNCGRYTATDNSGQHYFLNHANTWQTFQGMQPEARGVVGVQTVMPEQPTQEMVDAFRKAHDEHAALRIPKVYARGQREEQNIIVGYRAMREAWMRSTQQPAAMTERPVICEKCGAVSGDDWKQCGGACPLPDSPHYRPAAVDVDYNYGLQFIRDRAGTIRDLILALCAGPTERYVVEKTLQHLATQHQEPT